MIRVYARFVLAGLVEIGGGYLVWQSWRHGRFPGGRIAGRYLILFLYGIAATRNEFASFGKAYAGYGGVFIILAVLWGWGLDHRRPEISEWIGAANCFVGRAITGTRP